MKRPWKSFLIRGLVFLGLPVVALLVVVIVLSQSWHHEAMQQMVGQRNLRAALSAASTINQRLDERAGEISRLADYVRTGHSLNEATAWAEDFDAGLVRVDCTPDGESVRESMASSGGPAQTDLAEFCEAASQPVLLTADGQTSLWFIAALDGSDLLLGGLFVQPMLDEILSIPFGSENLAVQIYDREHELLFGTGMKPISSHEMYHQGILAGLDGQNGILYPDLGHHGSHVIAFAPIPSVEWVLVTDEAWQDITTTWINTTQWLPLALIPLLIMLGAGVWYGYRQIVRPLQELQTQSADLSEGNTSALTHPVGGIPEIRDLQRVLHDTSDQLLRSRRNLEEYIGAMTDAIENERKDLAREIHDDALQDLIALKHSRLTQSTRPTQQDADDIQAVIEKLRRTVRGLRPPYLEDLGLVTALQMLAGEQPEQIPVEFISSGDEIRLPVQVELAFFRVAQEALANIRKHAGPCQVDLSIEYLTSNVTMRVHDNGCGFTPPQRLDDFGSSGKYGLLGMKERADLIGAQLRVEAAPGMGCSVTLVYFLINTEKGSPVTGV
jgi:signal transduction histidine kinase